MGHTKPQDLLDVQELLAQVRSWEHIREKSPNVFYYKSKPFLHFHDKAGRRWADVLEGGAWGPEVELPFRASAKLKATFLKEALRRYKLFADG